MAKGYWCEICDKSFKGAPDLQMFLNKALESLLRFTLGIKISPESEEANTYQKDLCPGCAESYVKWYKEQRDKEVKNG